MSIPYLICALSYHLQESFSENSGLASHENQTVCNPINDMCLASSSRRFWPKNNKQEPTLGQILSTVSIKLQIPWKLKTKNHKDFTIATIQVKNRKFKAWNKLPVFLPWGNNLGGRGRGGEEEDSEKTIAQRSFSGFSSGLSKHSFAASLEISLPHTFPRVCL